MHPKLWIAAIALAIPISIVAAQPLSSPAEVAPGAVQADHYPSAQVTFSNGVRGKPGLVYSRQSGYRPLLLDLHP